MLTSSRSAEVQQHASSGAAAPTASRKELVSLEEILRDRFAIGIPALTGLSLATSSSADAPIGVMATVDADAGTLTLDEPAVG